MNIYKIPMQLAGTSLGFGLIGSKLDSQGLQSATSITNKFMPMSINVSMGGHLIKQIKKIKKS